MSRKPFTSQEIQQMWLWVYDELKAENPDALVSCGLQLWKSFIEKYKIQDRSADSLATRFRKYMKPEIIKAPLKPHQIKFIIQESGWIISPSNQRILDKLLAEEKGENIKKEGDMSGYVTDDTTSTPSRLKFDDFSVNEMTMETKANDKSLNSSINETPASSKLKQSSITAYFSSASKVNVSNTTLDTHLKNSESLKIADAISPPKKSRASEDIVANTSAKCPKIEVSETASSTETSNTRPSRRSKVAVNYNEVALSRRASLASNVTLENPTSTQPTEVIVKEEQLSGNDVSLEGIETSSSGNNTSQRRAGRPKKRFIETTPCDFEEPSPKRLISENTEAIPENSNSQNMELIPKRLLNENDNTVENTVENNSTNKENVHFTEIQNPIFNVEVKIEKDISFEFQNQTQNIQSPKKSDEGNSKENMDIVETSTFSLTNEINVNGKEASLESFEENKRIFSSVKIVDDEPTVKIIETISNGSVDEDTPLESSHPEPIITSFASAKTTKNLTPVKPRTPSDALIITPRSILASAQRKAKEDGSALRVRFKSPDKFKNEEDVTPKRILPSPLVRKSSNNNDIPSPSSVVRKTPETIVFSEITRELLESMWHKIHGENVENLSSNDFEELQKITIFKDFAIRAGHVNSFLRQRKTKQRDDSPSK